MTLHKKDSIIELDFCNYKQAFCIGGIVMEKKKNRTCLKNTMTPKELDQFSKKISTIYATSELHFAKAYFTRKYNITSSCFYWLLDRSVVRNLVPDEIVDKMRKKAVTNSNIISRENANKNTIASDVHYARLIQERKWFIFLQDFSEEDKIKITTFFEEYMELSKEECAGRTRTYLQNTLSPKELNRFSEQVSTSYATSELDASRSYFTKAYNITSSCFHWLLEWSVVRDLVPDEIVDKMRQKSSANSNRKSQENANKSTMASDVYYAKLIRERKWFIFLRDFPEEDKIKITTFFAKHPEVSKEECAKRFGLSKASLDKIVEDSLLENRVDDEIFLKVQMRSLGANPSKVAIDYFTKLKRKRNQNKKTAS